MPTLIKLLIKPSKENKLNVKSCSDKLEFKTEISLEKDISLPRTFLPISWIELDIRKLIFNIYSIIKYEKFISIAKINSLNTNWKGFSTLVSE